MPSTPVTFNPLELSNLDGIIGTVFNGVSAEDYSGISVASAGDMNGDDINDLIIGAYQASPGGRNAAGSSFIVFGSSSSYGGVLELSALNGTNGFRINGVTANDQSGKSVASAGDINGDGLSDLIIGAELATPGGRSYAGSSFVVFGTRAGFGAVLELSALNGTNGFRINGISNGDASGWSVASAGDINGDGLSDLIIGAYRASPDERSVAGSSFVVFGTRASFGPVLELSSLNGANGFRINGVSAGDWSGYSVASADDINGDGLSDLIIGASEADPGNRTDAGSSFVVFGSSSSYGAELELSALNGANGFRINGVTANDQSGKSVASAGDINGDGLSDLIIGASGADPGNRTDAGSSFVVFGSSSGYGAELELSALNGANGFRINGVAAGDYSGSVAGAGDMNGDGISDLIIGASEADPGGRNAAGSSFVVFGAPSGYGGALELSALNATQGFRINGVTAGDYSGLPAASAGDMNGDGLSDLIIGAYRADSGGRANTGSTYLILGDGLKLLNNTLTIKQGQTVFLDGSMLAVSHPNPAMDAGIAFRISNVMHGNFSTLNFPKSALSQNLVSFMHDNSSYAPSFEITAFGKRAIIGPVAATINFNVPPVLIVNPFSIGQGQIVILTNEMIRATSFYYPPDVLMFNISNVSYGNFVRTSTTIITNQFNQSVLTGGQIAFMTDGNATAPSYDISVSDGISTTPATHGTVNFNAAPVLLSNRLTLTPGQPKVILSSNELSASDAETALGELIFTPLTLNCHFENINLPGTSLPSFLQGNIQGSQIVFVWDGHTAPLYNMSVSDGMLSTIRPASINIVSDSNITSTIINNTESTNTGAIAGGVIGAVAGLGLLFGLQWYLKKKANEQFQKILLEGTSDAEKAFNKDVVRPIANKIFDVINTTGCFGRRSEADTKVYMTAILKIISELSRQNANLDFNAMEPIDKESFINEIANQTRQQSLPKRKGCSFGRCTRYFKAEATPQEIEHAAEGIALAAVAWQKRHISNVSAKSTNLGLELEKLSSLGFSEVANEETPPQKQFTWMQNHVKAMEQLEQERKRLEEQVAWQEAELAAFRRQGGGVIAMAAV